MYYDQLMRRARAARAVKDRQRDALAVLDAIDITQHIAAVYKPLHDDIEAAAHL